MSQFTKPEKAPDGPAVATRPVFAIKLEHGRQEVVRTWGAGIRALRTEPRYVLGGGRDEA